MIKQNKAWLTPKLIFSGIAVTFFAVLVYLFPYTSDDWAWGSQIGLDRLATFFDHYNGRYLGNLLVLALTRSRLLSALVTAAGIYTACWLCYRYTPERSTLLLLVSFMLLFVMPRNVFAQTVVWASGFSNYVPSAIGSVAYLLIVKNITGKNLPEYKKGVSVLTFCLGFFGALFVENITLYSVCFAVAVIGYTYIKFKKFRAPHVAFLVGAVAGAAVMFSNSVYLSSFAGTHGDRNVTHGMAEMISTCVGHVYIALNTLVLSNVVMCAVISLMLVLLTIAFVKGKQPAGKKKLAVCTAVVNVLCIFIILLEIVFARFFPNSAIAGMLQVNYVRIGIAALFVISMIASVSLCVDQNRRFAMLLPVLCIPVMVAPLLFVNPVGPRCFFSAYLMLMVFAVDLIGYVVGMGSAKGFSHKRLLAGCTVIALLQAIMLVAVYYPVHKYDVKRTEFINKQLQNGEDQIVICELPNAEYMWESSPDEDWVAHYKAFYGIDSEKELVILPMDAFDTFYKEYIEKQ